MTPITVYATPWCEVARNLRIYLNRHKIPHTFKNVESDLLDKEAALSFKDGNYHAPVVIVGERNMLNPTISVLERELKNQGVLE